MSRDLPVLRTPGLVLRPFTVEDSEDVALLAGDASISDTTLNIPHPYETSDAVEWISTHRGAFEKDGSLTLAVTLAETGELVGCVGLTVLRQHNRAELGYWTAKPHWGKGFSTEAARELLRYGFEELELNRIYATHFIGNPASGAVMRKLGMRFEGIQREHVAKEGSYEDLAVYGILRGEC